MEPERPDPRRAAAPYWVIVISSGFVVVLSLVAAIVDGSAWQWFVAAVAAGLCAAGIVNLRRALRGASESLMLRPPGPGRRQASRGLNLPIRSEQRWRAGVDCMGMGPLASRLEHLAASPFGGAARVVILDGTSADTGRVNWTLGLTDLTGQPLGHHHPHMPEESDVLHVIQRYLEAGGLTIQGEWIPSPDVVRPRYYGRVLATSGMN